MNDRQKANGPPDETVFSRRVRAQAARKQRAQRRTTAGIWFGLGMSGLIGWSVMLPTLLGVALGVWVDERHSSGYSWTLMLMLIGLIIGCLNAWQWMSREQQAVRKEQEDE